jgi:hypothetical protein
VSALAGLGGLDLVSRQKTRGQRGSIGRAQLHAGIVAVWPCVATVALANPNPTATFTGANTITLPAAVTVSASAALAACTASSTLTSSRSLTPDLAGGVLR